MPADFRTRRAAFRVRPPASGPTEKSQPRTVPLVLATMNERRPRRGRRLIGDFPERPHLRRPCRNGTVRTSGRRRYRLMGPRAAKPIAPPPAIYSYSPAASPAMGLEGADFGARAMRFFGADFFGAAASAGPSVAAASVEAVAPVSADLGAPPCPVALPNRPSLPRRLGAPAPPSAVVTSSATSSAALAEAAALGLAATLRFAAVLLTALLPFAAAGRFDALVGTGDASPVTGTSGAAT
ncbi:hypothetical protein PMI02_04524, partial [Novosphingobium sp. AP12]